MQKKALVLIIPISMLITSLANLRQHLGDNSS